MKYVLLSIIILTIPVYAQQNRDAKKETYKLYAKVFDSYKTQANVKLKSMTIVGVLLSEFADTTSGSLKIKLDREKLLTEAEWQFLMNYENYRDKSHVKEKVQNGALKNIFVIGV